MAITYTPIAADERFHVLGFEATQVMQNVPSSVPLVADKPTLVRVYLNAVGSTSKIDNVQGTLFAYRPQSSLLDRGLPLPGVVHSSNAISVDTSTDLKARRLKLDGSLNFELPAAWIIDGAVHFEVALDVDGSPNSPVAIPCDGCNNTFFNGVPVFVHFVTMPVFRLRIVGMQYALGSPPMMQAPRNLDFALLQSWVQRAYPAANFDVTTSIVTSSHAWPFNCNAANAQLSTVRATEVAAGRDPHTHYLALVINAGGFMRGCASGIRDSPDTTVVASSPTGDTAFGFGPRPLNVVGDTDGSYGDWYGGHELAHQFGRAHPGFCNENSSDDDSFPNPNGQISDNLQTHVGLDKGDAANAISQKVISPFAFDIMTYCNQPQWFSGYNYLAVLQRFRAENNLPNLLQAGRPGIATAPSSQPLPNEAMVGDFVSIVASVNLTRNTGMIRHVDRVTRATVPATQPNQIASVRLRDKSGRVIKSFPAWVRVDTDIAVGLRQTRLALTDQQVQGRSDRRVRVIANDGYNASAPATVELKSAK